MEDMERVLISDKVYEENKLFLDTKVKYLIDNYSNERTIQTYFDMFKKFVLPMENSINKDLYEFNEDEATQLITSVPTSSIRIKKSLITLCAMYVDYYVKVRKYRIGTNPFDTMDTSKLSLTVNKRSLKSEYISLDDFYDLCYKAEAKECSYRTILLALLTRYGVFGENGKYLLDIKTEHIIRESNTMKIVDDDTGELLSVIYIYDDRIYEWIDKAMNENVLISKKTAKETYFHYSEGRLIRTNRMNSNRLSFPRLYGLLKEFFDTVEHKPISFKRLVRCAKFDAIDRIYRMNGELTIDDFKSIDKMYSPESSETSYYLLKSDYKVLHPDVKVIGEFK